MQHQRESNMASKFNMSPLADKQEKYSSGGEPKNQSIDTQFGHKPARFLLPHKVQNRWDGTATYQLELAAGPVLTF